MSSHTLSIQLCVDEAIGLAEFETTPRLLKRLVPTVTASPGNWDHSSRTRATTEVTQASAAGVITTVAG